MKCTISLEFPSDILSRHAIFRPFGDVFTIEQSVKLKNMCSILKIRNIFKKITVSVKRSKLMLLKVSVSKIEKGRIVAIFQRFFLFFF